MDKSSKPRSGEEPDNLPLLDARKIGDGVPASAWRNRIYLGEVELLSGLWGNGVASSGRGRAFILPVEEEDGLTESGLSAHEHRSQRP